MRQSFDPPPYLLRRWGCGLVVVGVYAVVKAVAWLVGEDWRLTMKKIVDDLAFRQGYYLAVATLVRMHDQPGMAAELLRAFGKINFHGIDEFDLEVLKPVVANEMRKRLATTT